MRPGRKGALRTVPFLSVVSSLLLLAACNPGKGKTAYLGATLWDGTGAPPLRDTALVVTLQDIGRLFS